MQLVPFKKQQSVKELLNSLNQYIDFKNMICSSASLLTDNGAYSVDQNLQAHVCFRDMDRVKVSVTSKGAKDQTKPVETKKPEKKENVQVKAASPFIQKNEPHSKQGQQTPKSQSTPKSDGKKS